MDKIIDLDNLKEFQRVRSYGWTDKHLAPWERLRYTFFNLDIFLCVPGTTRPRRLLSHWPLPVQQRVIGFSFQLAIIQHQFALHALGYCHLCKDGKRALRFQTCSGAGEVALIGWSTGTRLLNLFLRRVSQLFRKHDPPRAGSSHPIWCSW